MIGTAITVLLVLVCAIYWATRLSPAFGRVFWSGTDRLLTACHAPEGVQFWVRRRAQGKKAGGCAGCSGCGSKGGGCH